MIVANDAAAFEADSSQATIIEKSGRVESLPELPKPEIADRILDAILRV
jgi:phosphopantothenoylcysteine synthetase/decarboxylase